MRIGMVAKIAGVGVETIRFYERKGLIDQPLKPRYGGFRSYPEETIVRLGFIRQAQEIGFSLREIGDLLSLKVDPSANCAQVRARAQKKFDTVNRKIKSLKMMRAALEELIARCPGEGAVDKCSILDALAAGVTAPNRDQVI
jgi:MerR family mercuric resistance operon transcriptional regulator